MRDDNEATKRELEDERAEMQKKVEKLEAERAELKWSLDEERSARKQLENDVKLLRLELEFSKRFNDQAKENDKAMQDLKDMRCAEWKRAAEEAQKAREQLQSVLLAMQNRAQADDTAKKVNKNTKALQDIPDKHSEKQKRVVDAYQAAQQVTRGCPNDDEIGEELQSLPSLIASNFNGIVVRSPAVGAAAAFCLITPPIAPGIDKSDTALAWVASVTFTLQSHDEGSAPRNPGTYNYSPTFFQAAIIRNSNPDVAIPLLSMGTMSNETLSRQLNHRDIWYSEGWEIQRNIAQSYESKTHVVTWSRSGTISEVEANRRGCGTGAGFLLALIPGDRIAVIARAMAGGLVNYVEGIEVQVTFSGI
ncbi:hypothetical protein AX14_001361 [Amanita brunnescens Koide BX004]|nr:hypothetical protein AX14_001361 [Amanita brunnescens Koide BX004]